MSTSSATVGQRAPRYRWLWKWDYQQGQFRFPFGIWETYRNGIRAARNRRGPRLAHIYRMSRYSWQYRMGL